MWKWLFVKLAILGTVFLFFVPSWAGDWAVSPNLDIVEEYNDNILFVRDEFELDDFVTYLKPRVRAEYGTERSRLSLNSRLEAEIYIDNDDLNTIDHDHRIAWSHALSRTLSLKAAGYFRQDTTLQKELEEEGILTSREDRQKFGGNVGFDHAFSSRLALSGDWTRRYTRYPNDPIEYDDRQQHTLELVPRYALSPQTSLFLVLAYTNSEYDDELDSSIDNYSIQPALRHDFSEDFYVSGRAGYRYTEAEAGNTDENTDGYIFNVSFHKNWAKGSMELLARRDQYSTIDRVSVERNALVLKGTYRLSARFATRIAAAFYRNREDRPRGRFGDEYDYYSVTPACSYNFTPAIALTGSATYDKYAYDEDTDRDRERFRASLALNFAWPRFWSGQ